MRGARRRLPRHPAGARARSWPEASRVTYPLVADPRRRCGAPLRGSAALPCMVFVDADGKVVDVEFRRSVLRRAAQLVQQHLDVRCRLSRCRGRLDRVPPSRQPPARRCPAWLEPVRRGADEITADDLTRFVAARGRAAPAAGAVLMLFGEGAGGPDLLLTERAHDMRSHPGPGVVPRRLDRPRRRRPREAAALREAEEETGLDPAGVRGLRDAARAVAAAEQLRGHPGARLVARGEPGRRRRPRRGARGLPGPDRGAARPGAPDLGAAPVAAGRARAS